MAPMPAPDRHPDPRLEAHIRARVPDYLQELAALCRLPSISAEGRALRETAEALAALMERWGIPATIVETADAPAVYADLPGRSPVTLLAYNHYDVQPPDPLDEWTSPPFEPVIRDGRMVARGVADDKGDLLVRLAAIEALLAVRGELPMRVKILVEGQEEIDGPAIQDWIREHPDRLACDLAFVEAADLGPDGRPGLVLGTRGMLYVELEASGPSVDLHSSMAAATVNPAWRLVRALACLVDEPTGRVRIPGFHDGIVPLTDLDRAFIADLPDPTERWPVELGIAAPADKAERDRVIGEMVGAPTATICGLSAGYAGPGMKTVLPAKARAKIDFRLVPGQHPADILAKLRAHLDAEGFGDIRIVVHTQDGYPARTPSDDPWVQRVAAITGEWYGARPAIWPNSAGGIVMAPFIEALGAPTMFGGIRPLGGRYHAPDEFIEVESFAPAVRFFAHLLERLGEASDGDSSA
jgi:acetylornithine deacetylase/succinyl-diaminopimelate desuccinylase-like protein